MLATGFSNPLRYNTKALVGGSPHPLEDMPIEIVSQMDDVVEDPMIVMFDHFLKYYGTLAENAAGPYRLTGTVGTATIALTPNAEYGAIRVSTSNVEDDNLMLRQTDMTFLYDTDQLTVVAARMSLSDVDDMEVFFGIAETNVDFVAALPTYGIFFEKAEAATNFDFHVRDASTSTENTADFAGVVLADDTPFVLAIRIENGNITPYMWTAATGWVAGTTVAKTDANLPDDPGDIMQCQLGIETGAAAAAYADLDWLLLAKSR